MRRILTCLFLLNIVLLKAQTPEADSLTHILEQQGQDTSRVNTLLKLAWTIRNDHPQRAMDYSQQALKLSSALNFERGKATAYSTIGVLHYRAGAMADAISAHLLSYDIREKIGDENGVARSSINLGNIYSDMHDTTHAMEYYLKALEILERGNDQERLAIVCLDIGGLYLAEYQVEQANRFARRALEIGIATDDLLLQAQALNNIGVGFEYGIMPDSALYVYKKAYDLAEQLGDKVMIVDAGMNIGNIYRAKKQYDEAIRWHSEMIVQANSIGYVEGLRGLYEQLTEDYSRKGDYKTALEMHIRFKAISDSIYNEEASERLVQVQAQYETEKKEMEVQRLTSMLKEEGRDSQLTIGFIAGGAVLFVVIVVVVVILIVTAGNRRRDRMIIASQQQELNYLKWKTPPKQ